MSIEQPALQSLILKVLSEPRSDTRLGRGQYYLTEAVRKKAEIPNIDSRKIMAAIWSLISQGLAFIDYSQPAPENWNLYLTDSGKAAVQDSDINPNDSGKYLENLTDRIPQIANLVMQYAREAVITYNSRCYLASAVMLGVASEAAFLNMAESFLKWIPNEKERSNFTNIIENKKQNYINKFLEFRKRVQTYKSEIPDELTDNMSLTMDSILDLLRIYRNESGHPTGRNISREDAFINLQMFARYLEKIYKLKSFFESDNIR